MLCFTVLETRSFDYFADDTEANLNQVNYVRGADSKIVCSSRIHTFEAQLMGNEEKITIAQ